MRERRLVAALTAILVACGSSSPPSAAGNDPAELLRLAIEAHGGAAALAELDDLRVASSIVFGEGVRLERSLHFHAPSSLAMTISQDGHEGMAFGLDGDRCWRRARAFVLACEPSDVADHRRILGVLEARLLHRIDPARATGAGTVRVGDVDAPAIRIGSLRLAFDPVAHHLLAIDYVDREQHHVEIYSELVGVGRARFASHRVLTIDGEPDVSETWTEIVPGGSDAAAFAAGVAPTPGAIFDGDDPARPVVWVEVDRIADRARPGEDRLALGHRELLAFASEHSMRESGNEGPIVFWVDGVEHIAITLEETREFASVDEGLFHVTTWPAAWYAGTWMRGAPDDADAASERLAQLATEQGHRRAEGAPVELLLEPGAQHQPEDERFGLLRVAVAP